MNTIDKVAWIHIQDRAVLAVRSFGKDVFYIPGGKREAEESDLQTLTREIQEELSVSIVPGTEKYYGHFLAAAHGKKPDTMVRIKCYTAAYTGELAPGAEIEEAAFLGARDKARVSAANALILEDLKQKGWIE